MLHSLHSDKTLYKGLQIITNIKKLKFKEDVKYNFLKRVLHISIISKISIQIQTFLAMCNYDNRFIE